MMRTAVALILAPLPAMLISGFFLHQHMPKYGLLGGFAGLMVIAYLWETLIILPGHLLLARSKHAALADYLLLGFLGFALPMLVYMIYKSPGMLAREVTLATYWGILGTSITWLFWLLRKPLRNRSVANHSSPVPSPTPQQ